MGGGAGGRRGPDAAAAVEVAGAAAPADAGRPPHFEPQAASFRTSRLAALGIRSARGDCDVDSIGSRRVIEMDGGVLDEERAGSLSFWVPAG
jgi:hypothetical protein